MNKNILDFGAIGDGKTLCSTAIQAAIDECSATGGGRVTVPAGTYVSGTIWFRDNVDLHLEHGATIKASGNMDDYNEVDAYPQNGSNPKGEKWVGRHLMIALECKNIALTGTGVIDGSGDLFYADPIHHARFCWTEGLSWAKDLVNYRPGQLICIIECQNIHVENVTLQNMTCWGLFLHGCDFAVINGIKIYNNITYANTDGIDIDSSSHVTVTNCIIETGDDAIAIRGNAVQLKQNEKACEFVTISNCVLGSASSVFRIGVGSTVIRHVNVENIVVTRGSSLFTFMADYLGRGHVSMEDVNFRNVSAINLAYFCEFFEHSGAYIKNINIENVRAEACAHAFLKATNKGCVENICFRNIELTMTDYITARNDGEIEQRGRYMFEAKDIVGLKLDNFKIKATPEVKALWDDVLKLDNCSDVEFNRVSLPQ